MSAAMQIGGEEFLCPRRVEGAVFKLPEKDHWRTYDDEPGHRGCSYCGSMHPADVFAAVEGGAELTPTDKSYKVYVGGASHKFYFQHFDAHEQQRFVDLLNAKAIKLAYPGRFYVPPFFVQFGPVPR